MLKMKKGKLLYPYTRAELVDEIRRLNRAISELATFLRNTDKEALAGVMDIVKDRDRDFVEGDEF